jgi:hypothetical protein
MLPGSFQKVGNPWHTVVSVETVIHHLFQYSGGSQGKIKPSEPAPTPRLVRLRMRSDDGRPSHIVRKNIVSIRTQRAGL